jgi:uncharacterized protein (DUF1778 family)
MDTTSIISGIETALTDQLYLAGDDAAVVAAGEAVVAALGPALSKAALELAEQAAAEVGAQLPDYEVSVVLQEGEPSLTVRSIEPEVSFSTDDLGARLTLRLPPDLKAAIEDAAGSTGDSVNAYVVKTLSRRGSGRSGKRITGRFQT